MELFLCGWYAYEAVLAGLMAASAGPRTWLGRIGWAAAAVAVFTLLAQRAVMTTGPQLQLGAKVAVLVAGVAGLALGRRADTRLIALLLAAAAAVPVVLTFVDLP